MTSLLRSLLLLIICLLPTLSRAIEPVDIGSRRELFVDRHIIASTHNIQLRLHHPHSQDVALKFDRPWEGNTSGYVTVMQDGDLLKMIYCGHRMVWGSGQLLMSHSPVVCYAESRDGIHWHKPNLRLFPWRGLRSKELNDPLDNNIVWPGSSESGTFVPFLDTRPGCPTDKKFKAVGGIAATGLFLFTSPDAIHWTKSDEPIFRDGVFDSMNVVYWDPAQQQYVLYFRTIKNRMRAVSRSTSPDLQQWTEPIDLEYPGSPPQQMYTNQIAPYFRAPHVLFGFPTRYVARTMTEQIRSLPPVQLRNELTTAFARVGSDLTDGLFMSSRDGIRFQRRDEAFLRPGPQADDQHSYWMYGDNYQNYGLFRTASDRPGAPDEISMLFSEGYWNDDQTRLRRHTIRVDGFVSANAPFAGGELVTKPLIWSGTQLVVNYSTSAAGSLRVEIQTEDGQPVSGHALEDCPEIIGDHVNHVVKWTEGSSVAELAGRPLRLRFVLKDADLFSFCFPPTDASR